MIITVANQNCKIFTFENYYNPLTLCDLEFTCSNFIERYSSFTLASLESNILLRKVDFNVEAEPGSMVGGDYYVNVSFRTSTTFPAQGIIQITGLKLMISNACNDLVEVKFSSSVLPIICTYDMTNGIKITTQTTQDIDMDTYVTIRVNKVRYLEYLGTSRVTVKINHGTTFICDIKYSQTLTESLAESSFDNWGPDSASTFVQPFTLDVTFASGSDNTFATCRVGTFVWRATLLAVGIRRDQVFRITFSTKVEMGNLLGTNVNNLKKISDTEVEGRFTRNFAANTVMTFEISNIALPSTSIPLITTLNTFGDTTSQLVYSDSTVPIQAIPPIISSGSVNFESIQGSSVKLIVSEKSSYIANIPGGCADVVNTKYVINYPSIFSATTEVCAELSCTVDPIGRTITFSTSETLSKGDSVNREFQLINSIYEASITTSTIFPIEVYDTDVGALAYTVEANLGHDIEFVHGDFISFSVSSESSTDGDCKISGANCIYTFDVVVNHLIPSNGKLIITLDSSVAHGNSCRVTTSNSYVTGNCIDDDKIILNLSQGAVKESEIEIAVEYLKNPVFTGTYSQFSIESFTKENYRIDSSNENTNGYRTILIDVPGEADINYSIEDPTNLATTRYTFTFTSREFGIPYNSKTHCLSVTLPNQVSSSGQYESLNRLIFRSYNSKQYIFELIPGISTERELSFVIHCTNPTITIETDPVEFTLCTKDTTCTGCTQSDSILLKAQKPIRTTKGVALGVVLIQSTSNYPNTKGQATLKLTRKSTSRIRLVVIENRYLDCDETACDVTPKAKCTCKKDISPIKKLTLEFTDGVVNDSEIYCLINVIYPSTSSETNGYFSIITYDYDSPNEHYIVDQIDKTTDKITAKCDFPCLDCENNAPTKCRSCSRDSYNGGYYYFYPTYSNCKLLTSGMKCEDGITNDHGYITDTINYQCNDCNSKCKACENTINYCTKCISGYAYKGDCQDDCYDGTHIDEDTCRDCVSPCALCSSATKCLKCQSTHLLDEDTCVDECPAIGKYPSEGECKACSKNCRTCSGTEDYCESCSAGYLLNNKCVTKEKCEESEDHVGINNECLRCEGMCSKCVTSTTYCTKCIGNYYPNAGICLECDVSCDKCEGSAKNCSACSSGYYSDADKCVNPCPYHKTPIDGECKECYSRCDACEGDINHCTSCRGNYYLYLGNCIDDCPNRTISIEEPRKSCLKCDSGCNQCILENSDIVCIKCDSEYKYLDGKCHYVCPTGYIPSSDNMSCINDPNNNENSSSNASLPFPHLIVAGLLCIGVAAGQARDGRALIASNLLIALSYVMFVLCIVQAAFALADSRTFVAIATFIALGVQVVLNLLFLIPYVKSISSDSGFALWERAHVCLKKVIVVLSSIFSLQTYRVLYSRFFGFGTFFVSFTNFDKVLLPLNIFSLVQILLVNFLIVCEDIFGFIKYSWGTNLYVTMIESIILSSLIIVLIAYEMKSTKTTQDELERTVTIYRKLSNQSSILPDKISEKEILRKETVKSVFMELGFKSLAQFNRSNPRKVPIRRHSFTPRTNYPKTKDLRSSYSSPCSPRTTEQKQVPLKKYGIIDSSHLSSFTLPSGKLIDNIYFDSVEPSNSHLSLSSNDTANKEVQTPPFHKIEAFRQHLKTQGLLKKRLFDSEKPGPLEAITESPEEHENKDKFTVTDTTLINKGSTDLIDTIKDFSKRMLIFPDTAKTLSINLVEEEKLSSKIRAASPPQVSNEASDVLLSRPLNPIDNTMEDLSYPETGLNISHNSVGILEYKERNKVEKSKSAIEAGSADVKIVNSEELMGSFERDPTDGYIIIRENSKGLLLDLKGRTVNKLGYLIDKEGNIINKQGEYIMSKSELERVIQNETNQSAPRTTPLFKEDGFQSIQDQAIEVVNEKTKTDVKQDSKDNSDKVNKARDSISLDSLMDDTPSNYNLLNQRYDSGHKTVDGKVKEFLEVEGKTEVLNLYETHKEEKNNFKGYKHHNLLTKKESVAKITKSNHNSENGSKFITPNVRKYRKKKFSKGSKKDMGSNIHCKKKHKLPENSKKKWRSSPQKKDYDEDHKIKGEIKENPESTFKKLDNDLLGLPAVPSNMLIKTGSIAKIRGLESIYLQNLRNSSKSKMKTQRSTQKVKESPKIESEHDEIASFLSDNYNNMKNRYKELEYMTYDEKYRSNS